MERLVLVLVMLAALLVGLVIGQQTARPFTLPEPTTVAAATTEPVSDKLTPYQRGKLITNCYQAAAVYRNPLNAGGSGSPANCLAEIGKLP